MGGEKETGKTRTRTVAEDQTSTAIPVISERAPTPRVRAALFRQGSRCSLRHALEPANFPPPRKMRLTSRHRPMLLAISASPDPSNQPTNHPPLPPATLNKSSTVERTTLPPFRLRLANHPRLSPAFLLTVLRRRRERNEAGDCARNVNFCIHYHILQQYFKDQFGSACESTYHPSLLSDLSRYVSERIIGENKRDRRKVHRGTASFYRNSHVPGKGKKKEEKEKTKQETHHTMESECSALNFPRENHLIPQPRFLFPQTGMKYLFAYASPGLTAVSELPASSTLRNPINV
ncbi:hypothetical protein EAG_02872 [Camponotus floridanus]|uniref:Uncharacterized protein n=1 Tax=Camponotus floridanus TaxID=104421 RepID=E2AGF2_CAMFO|nr:hypothetical protein EAG_02872 [Camponotus floridanus]